MASSKREVVWAWCHRMVKTVLICACKRGGGGVVLSKDENGTTSGSLLRAREVVWVWRCGNVKTGVWRHRKTKTKPPPARFCMRWRWCGCGVVERRKQGCGVVERRKQNHLQLAFACEGGGVGVALLEDENGGCGVVKRRKRNHLLLAFACDGGGFGVVLSKCDNGTTSDSLLHAREVARAWRCQNVRMKPVWRRRNQCGIVETSEASSKPWCVWCHRNVKTEPPLARFCTRGRWCERGVVGIRK